ncbi:MAG TPA: GntR family transcriptional regulator [Candidatus Kapabacteria bacterium]
MEFSFSIDAASALPIYAQVERGIRQGVATGILRVGDQLPTVRELAVMLRINANTVAKVYRDLERVGLLETRRGVGTFIAVREKKPTKRERERRIAEIRADLLARIQMEGISLLEMIEELNSIHTNTK